MGGPFALLHARATGRRETLWTSRAVAYATALRKRCRAARRGAVDAVCPVAAARGAPQRRPRSSRRSASSTPALPPCRCAHRRLRDDGASRRDGTTEPSCTESAMNRIPGCFSKNSPGVRLAPMLRRSPADRIAGGSACVGRGRPSRVRWFEAVEPRCDSAFRSCWLEHRPEASDRRPDPAVCGRPGDDRRLGCGGDIRRHGPGSHDDDGSDSRGTRRRRRGGSADGAVLAGAVRRGDADNEHRCTATSCH
jgi:hypothetical protein